MSATDAVHRSSQVGGDYQTGAGAQVVDASAAEASAADSASVYVSDDTSRTTRRVNQGNIFNPEVLAGGGLEGALLLLMVERDNLFKNSLDSKIAGSRVLNERIRENNQEQIDTQKKALKEMEKAQKAGKIASIVGWVGVAIGAATIGVMTLGAGSLLLTAGVVASFGVTLAMQVDAETGGNMMEFLSGGDDKKELGIMIGLSLASILLSAGAAGLASMGKATGKAATLSSSSSKMAAAGASSSSNSSSVTAAGTQVAGKATNNVAQSGARSITGQTGQISDDLLTNTSALSDDATSALAGGSNNAIKGGAGTKPTATMPARSSYNIFNPSPLDGAKLRAGDHPIQIAGANLSAANMIAETGVSIRGSISNFQAEMFAAEVKKKSAKEKRLNTYLEYMQQIIEDVLVQLNKGNKTLYRQLEIAYEPKAAITMGLKVGG